MSFFKWLGGGYDDEVREGQERAQRAERARTEDLERNREQIREMQEERLQAERLQEEQHRAEVNRLQTDMQGAYNCMRQDMKEQLGVLMDEKRDADKRHDEEKQALKTEREKIRQKYDDDMEKAREQSKKARERLEKRHEGDLDVLRKDMEAERKRTDEKEMRLTNRMEQEKAEIRQVHEREVGELKSEVKKEKDTIERLAESRVKDIKEDKERLDQLHKNEKENMDRNMKDAKETWKKTMEERTCLLSKERERVEASLNSQLELERNNTERERSQREEDVKSLKTEARDAIHAQNEKHQQEKEKMGDAFSHMMREIQQANRDDKERMSKFHMEYLEQLKADRKHEREIEDAKQKRLEERSLCDGKRLDKMISFQQRTLDHLLYNANGHRQRGALQYDMDQRLAIDGPHNDYYDDEYDDDDDDDEASFQRRRQHLLARGNRRPQRRSRPQYYDEGEYYVRPTYRRDEPRYPPQRRDMTQDDSAYDREDRYRPAYERGGREFRSAGSSVYYTDDYEQYMQRPGGHRQGPDRSVRTDEESFKRGQPEKTERGRRQVFPEYDVFRTRNCYEDGRPQRPPQGPYRPPMAPEEEYEERIFRKQTGGRGENLQSFDQHGDVDERRAGRGRGEWSASWSREQDRAVYRSARGSREEPDAPGPANAHDTDLEDHRQRDFREFQDRGRPAVSFNGDYVEEKARRRERTQEGVPAFRSCEDPEGQAGGAPGGRDASPKKDPRDEDFRQNQKTTTAGDPLDGEYAGQSQDQLMPDFDSSRQDKYRRPSPSAELLPGRKPYPPNQWYADDPQKNHTGGGGGDFRREVQGPDPRRQTRGVTGSSTGHPPVRPGERHDDCDSDSESREDASRQHARLPKHECPLDVLVTCTQDEDQENGGLLADDDAQSAILSGSDSGSFVVLDPARNPEH